MRNRIIVAAALFAVCVPAMAQAPDPGQDPNQAANQAPSPQATPDARDRIFYPDDRLGSVGFRGIDEGGAKLNSGAQSFRAASILPRAEGELGDLYSGIPQLL